MKRVSLAQRGHAYGMTIVELLLALAGTAFVAVAIAMMLSVVASGTSSRTDLRQSVVRQKTITARLNAAIRSSSMVLVAEDDLLIVWTNDTDSNSEPSLGEIQRIERDAATGELRAYKTPLTLAEADNTAYTLATDFDSITTALKGNANFPQEVWAIGLHSWTITVNAETAQDATLVSSRIVIGEGDMTETVISAAALRNNGTTSFSSSSGESIDSDVTEDGDDSSQSGASSNGSSGQSDTNTNSNDDDDEDDADDDVKGKGKGKAKGKGKDKVDGDDKNKGKGNG